MSWVFELVQLQTTPFFSLHAKQDLLGGGRAGLLQCMLPVHFSPQNEFVRLGDYQTSMGTAVFTSNVADVMADSLNSLCFVYSKIRLFLY